MPDIQFIISLIVLIILLGLFFKLLILKNKLTLAYFGKIVVQDDAYYESTIPFNQEELPIILSIESSNTKVKDFLPIESFLNQLDKINSDNYEYMKMNYESKDSAVQIFYELYLEAAKEKLELDNKPLTIDVFVDSMKLKKISFYPGTINFAVLDYTLRDNIANDLICIYYDKSLSPLYITMES